MNSAPLVEVRGISKSFGGVSALQDVSLSIETSEIHALCGENGAGKSTLIKIITGSVIPDSGHVLVSGRELDPGNVHASEAAGIAAIHQESTVFPHLNAEDNIFVGREPRRWLGLMLDRRTMRVQTRALLERLGECFEQRRPLAELTVTQRQMVSIARSLSRSCRLLIMDEPTSSLSARETEVLFRIIRQLRSDGVSTLYVSHRLEEVFELSDRVTVLRDGLRVDTQPTRNVTRQSLIRRMVGREMEELTSSGGRPSAPGDVLLEVRNLTRESLFRDVSLSVRAGEIVGLAGLVGAGRSEVAQTIFGIGKPDGGEIMVCGKRLSPGSIRAAMAAGLALVPEDRQRLGLVLPMSVGTNLSLAVLRKLTRGGLIAGRLEAELAARFIQALSVKAASANATTESLSGGNQQKVMLGKWLATSPRMLILDEPTRGVDVGAKAEVHRLIRQLATQGMGTLLISSELPELLSLTDRILVMRGGSISGELTRTQATQEKVLELALPES